jgi:predicted TIM-barrel fold metal-dependent hydrolase
MRSPSSSPGGKRSASAMHNGMTVIAIEEHYNDGELAGSGTGYAPDVLSRLRDLGEGRLRAMDDAGIDMQVLSLGAPFGAANPQELPAEAAIALTRRANNCLAAACAAHPTRFAGFAALATQVPDAAARELERCVKGFGFKGALVHPRTDGLFLDHKRFWPIFETAEKLDVPLYLHPAMPHPAVTEIYYGDYAQDFPVLPGAAWGFTVETATQAIRLILAGVFGAYPRLNIILGHLGEALPFLLWRANMALSRPGQGNIKFRECLSRNFHVTTSGNFSTPALLCTMLELGIDRIMFSVDYPFVANQDGMDWVKTLQLSSNDMDKLLGGNAKRLLKL